MAVYITQIWNMFLHRHLSGILAVGICFISCEKKSFTPAGIPDDIIIPYSIISVDQSVGATNAVIELKLPKSFSEDFQINLLTKNGTKVPLAEGLNSVLGNFILRSYSASQLVAGEDYTIKLNYSDAQNNIVETSRHFSAKQSRYWSKLPHAPIADGDFTGAALLSPQFGSQLAVYRYLNPAKWDILNFISGTWISSESDLPPPRHNAIAFPLGQEGGRELIFVGFGYINDEKLPYKRAYLNDFWWIPNYNYIGKSASIVFPSYTGIDREVKYFLTYDKIFMLKEDYTGAMRSMEITWDQKECKPLPEKTGKISAFTINEIGYVINQRDGIAPHLYAYDPTKDKWERKADFPGSNRVQGTAFAAGGKGYFGLGIDQNGVGLRDVWEYNKEKNIWIYHSEYPGQGNRYLIAFSDKDKAYIGWGYENRSLTGSAGKQQIGCTDFWEFKP